MILQIYHPSVAGPDLAGLAEGSSKIFQRQPITEVNTNVSLWFYVYVFTCLILIDPLYILMHRPENRLVKMQ